MDPPSIDPAMTFGPNQSEYDLVFRLDCYATCPLGPTDDLSVLLPIAPNGKGRSPYLNQSSLGHFGVGLSEVSL